MNIKNIIDDLVLNYIDTNLIVTIDKTPGPESTKNGLMHGGLVISLLDALGYKDEGLISIILAGFNKCKIPDEFGLYSRYPAYDSKPQCPDKTAYDDYIGVYTGSLLGGIGLLSTQIYNKFKTNLGFLNNVNIDKFEGWAFQGRFLHVALYYYLGVNNRFGFLNKVLMMFIQHKMRNSKNNYSHLLNFMIIQGMCSKYSNWLIFRNEYLISVDMVDKALDYFKSKDHPVVRLFELLKLNIDNNNS